MKYRIVRMYQDEKVPTRIIKVGLSLEEAQKHCSNPQTHSKEATTPEGIKHTKEFGPWFDGYEADK